jgi:hypothetical protein
MAPKDEGAVLKQFREELVQEDMLHEGDSIGTDDETLLCVAIYSITGFVHDDECISQTFPPSTTV